ncbi:PAS domain S-box protein [Fulvivirga sp. M361]|uniref:PAS domain S-box protein n=1 Tax=Fulvivirga sp. M361 TaxID=2594266 RepID=UPI00117BD292|nr:PAS domain S-box protein [Fulvivirga sp. M361]TRX60722.1 PAS domain S-box protein [Fulvivirga sp. M361]
MRPYNLLFTEDDDFTLMVYERMLKNWEKPCKYEFCTSIAQTKEKLKDHTFDVAILDYQLKDGDAFEILPHLNDIPVIFVSGMEDVSVAVEAMRNGAFDYLVKDFDHEFANVLPLTIERAIDHNKIKAQLKETEERYSDLFQNANDMIQSVSADGKFIHVNPAWVKKMEYTLEEAKELTFIDIIHPRDHKHCLKIFTQLLAGKVFKNEEVCFVTKSGKEVFVEGNIFCNLSDPISTRGIFHDITERKKAEEILKVAKTRYDLAVDAGKTGVVDWNMAENSAFIDEKLKLLLGFSNEEMENSIEAIGNRMHPDDMPRAEIDLKDYISGKSKRYEYEYRMLHKNGSVRWLLARAQAIRDENKMVVRLVGTGTDITAQKQIQDELEESRQELKSINENLESLVTQRTENLTKSNIQLQGEIKKRRIIEKELEKSKEDYQGLFENAHDPILIFDPDTQMVMDVNNRACEVYGFSRNEFIHMDLKTISKFPEASDQHTKAVLKKGKRHSYEAIQLKADGEEMHLEVSSSLVSYQDKKAILSINRDITRRKAMEKLIASERKKRLTAIIDGQEIERRRVSRELHDGLGQLLTAAKLRLRQLSKGSTDELFLENAKDTSEIIDLTISEVRKISYNLMPTVLNDFGLVAALEKMSHQLSSDSITSIVFNHKTTTERLPKDLEVGLYRVAQEAINNALKYAEATCIEVNLQESGEELSLDIKDNGKGFSEEAVAKNAINNSSGKGLYNMKERAELLDGKFIIDSKPGCGTTIKVLAHINTNDNGE